ncbi:flagellin N-terminal helical domain-containing protein [Bradyrhizobium sp. AZCC 1620]|uniref:flagellin N-terminal helical domain-containing protein n=1 Tax=Bradyrhizobium sp. AZCC 1620 TaxID=3117023 RepID=UPI002FF1EF55
MSLSNITLSASVRQNLLSLQGTADLLSTTQTRLATGKKVNSALDNPTNFFTAAGLDARASDIGNLLDSIGNGVQVLQAANTGITSLSKLVDTAKSIANQALQTTSGYSTKASLKTDGPTGAGVLDDAGTTTDLTNGGTNSLQGKTLVFTTATGATTLNISNVAGATNVNSIDSINTKLATAGIQLTASLDSAGAITFTSTNDAASQTITKTGSYAAPPAGSSTSVDISGTVGTTAAVSAAVVDVNSQNTRASLVAQYNQIIQQITTTAQDASFNGVNLLNGDTLKLVFNETGKSTSTITGVTFNPNGLGLGSATVGTDFIDNAATNKVLTALNTASTTLRSQASAFGANLSIVQIRQDFSKNLINVLQTGSSNLTLADSNEEAANSQALSTRQSIAVSALALANQSNQSVLQLLR